MPTEAEIAAQAAKAAADKAAADAAAAAAAKGPSKKQLQGDLAAAWGKIAMMERQLPELIESKAAQLVEKKIAEMGAKGAAGGKKDEPTADERLAKMEAELAERDKRALQAERKSKVASAFAGVAFMNERAQNIAVDDVLAIAQEKGGKLVVPTVRKLETTGEEITVDLPLAEAAQRYLANNDWLLKGKVQGGSGASGVGNNGAGAAGAAAQAVDWDGVKYKDLKANPVLMGRALKEKGQAWVDEKFAKYQAKRGGMSPAGGLPKFSGPRAAPAGNTDSSE